MPAFFISFFIYVILCRLFSSEQTAFLFLEKKAELYLDFQTESKYLQVSETSDVNAVKDCLCALVDSFNQEQQGKDINGAFKQSESVGGHSVSYVGKTTQSYESDRFNILKMYLWKLGILRSRKVFGLNEG